MADDLSGASQRSNVLIDTIIMRDQTDEDILDYEVSDESLENVGTSGNVAAYTLGFCTGLTVCQG